MGDGVINSTIAGLKQKHQAFLGEVKESMNALEEVAIQLEQNGYQDKVDILHIQVKEAEENFKQLILMEAKEKGALQALTDLNPIALMRMNDEDFDIIAEFKRLRDEYDSKINPARLFKEHPAFKQFRLKVWEVNHRGEPMPGLDEDVLVVASQEQSFICPLTRTELVEPVKNSVCGHVYSKEAIVSHIRAQERRRRRRGCPCPVAGCASTITVESLSPDEETIAKMKRAAKKGKRTQTMTQTAEEEDIMQV